ncbi:hypothetical protein [Prosthecobacter sp.]|uniref:hypothetical protein n=1 Tax=Prosthecobacter sp. TaxID=1965333 RepID=UPI003784CF42
MMIPVNRMATRDRAFVNDEGEEGGYDASVFCIEFWGNEKCHKKDTHQIRMLFIFCYVLNEDSASEEKRISPRPFEIGCRPKCCDAPSRAPSKMDRPADEIKSEPWWRWFDESHPAAGIHFWKRGQQAGGVCQEAGSERNA